METWDPHPPPPQLLPHRQLDPSSHRYNAQARLVHPHPKYAAQQPPWVPGPDPLMALVHLPAVPELQVPLPPDLPLLTPLPISLRHIVKIPLLRCAVLRHHRGTPSKVDTDRWEGVHPVRQGWHRRDTTRDEAHRCSSLPGRHLLERVGASEGAMGRLQCRHAAEAA